MTTYRIYETGNDTGKWFYAKQKSLWRWITPKFSELKKVGRLPIESKRFSSKDELLATINKAHEKRSINSIYHKVIDEITIPD